MPSLSIASGTTPHSGIRAMVREVAQHPGALSLVFGEPNFPTPVHIVEAAHRAGLAGRTGYAPSAGFPSLRAAIADKLAERNGVSADAAEVVVTTGGTGGLFTSLSLVLNPGDEVLVPDPGWSNYAAIVHVLHGKCCYYPVQPQPQSPELAALERLVTPKTRVLLLNSPGNPTGVVYDKEALLALNEFACAHDLWVVSDECYDETYFDDPPLSTASVGDRERVISIFTFSKTYAMTGWRVGYVLAPPQVARALELAQEPVVSCASSLSQAAAEAALRGPQDAVASMRQAYGERLSLVVPLLTRDQVDFIRPQGAFYLMVDISSLHMPSWDFATKLLNQYSVGVVPGQAFGPRGEGYVRISLAVSPSDLQEGVLRIIEAIKQWGGAGRGAMSTAGGSQV